MRALARQLSAPAPCQPGASPLSVPYPRTAGDRAGGSCCGLWPARPAPASRRCAPRQVREARDRSRAARDRSRAARPRRPFAPTRTAGRPVPEGIDPAAAIPSGRSDRVLALGRRGRGRGTGRLVAGLLADACQRPLQARTGAHGTVRGLHRRRDRRAGPAAVAALPARDRSGLLSPGRVAGGCRGAVAVHARHGALDGARRWSIRGSTPMRPLRVPSTFSPSCRSSSGRGSSPSLRTMPVRVGLSGRFESTEGALPGTTTCSCGFGTASPPRPGTSSPSSLRRCAPRTTRRRTASAIS